MNVPSEASDAVIAAEKPSPEDGGPCATCAFRQGTEANLSEHTMTLARLCVEGIEPFNCHEKPQACRGWNAAVNLRGAPETEDDRRWMEMNRAASEIVATLIDKARIEQELAEQSRGDGRRMKPRELTYAEIQDQLTEIQRTVSAAVTEMRVATSIAETVTGMMLARIGRHFTVDEAAMAWRVTPKTIRRKISAGDLTLEQIPGTHVMGIPADQIFGRWIDYRIAKAAAARENEAKR